ncbi:MAG: transglutaminase-like cysteine peptidase, partial [Methylophaga sp.]|nr:transglutaminase-like cysteine peptidase [Methylophaga sp.]
MTLLSWPLWADLDFSEAFLARIEAKYDRFARQRFEQWQALIKDAKDLPEKEKLEAVNRFFNSNVLFIDDIKLWEQEDYWATPAEMLAIGAGDCEDFSIAKYFTLKDLGVDEDKLRLTYVKAVELNQA